MSLAQFHQYAPENFTPTKVGNKYDYKPTELNITWGKDKRYWKINAEAAELLQVSWLEVTGTLTGELKPGKKYKITFKISMESLAFGWEGIPIYVMAKVGKKGKYTREIFYPVSGKSANISLTVTVPSDTKDLTLYFGLYEVFSGVWKGGLKIHRATVEETQDEN